MQLLAGKVAIITGSSRGVGKATAHLFSENGASVILSGNTEDRLKAVCDEITSAGGQAAYYAGDIAEEATTQRLFDMALEQFGTLDIVVNNAAISTRNKTFDVSYEYWHRMINVNVDGPMRLSLLAIRHFQKNGGGKIVNIASRAAKMPTAYAPTYGMSKLSLIHMTRCFAKEFAKDNINVNAILPSAIETDMSSDWDEAKRASVISTIPMGRMAQPIDIAHAALFLSCYMSDYISGAAIPVCGAGLLD